MSKVFDYFEERRKLGIFEGNCLQKRMSRAEYDDMRYREMVDEEAMRKADAARKRYSK